MCAGCERWSRPPLATGCGRSLLRPGDLGKRSDGYVHDAADRLLGPPSTARWNYATAKAFGEAMVHGYHRERSAEMATVRIFNTPLVRDRRAHTEWFSHASSRRRSPARL